MISPQRGVYLLFCSVLCCVNLVAAPLHPMLLIHAVSASLSRGDVSPWELWVVGLLSSSLHIFSVLTCRNTVRTKSCQNDVGWFLFSTNLVLYDNKDLDLDLI